MAATGHPGTAVVMGTSVVATVQTFRLRTPLLAIVGIGTLADLGIGVGDIGRRIARRAAYPCLDEPPLP